MEKILIFIAFLCPLIFFHELGHFLMARLFGVRVETFSIGFGPNLFKFHYGHTKYTISLIPLGGYVKMFGDDPFSPNPIPVEERRYAFNHKGKFARFWILFGGPLANFIFAYFIFMGILLTGEKVPEPKVGAVGKESILFQKGLLPGDRLVTINEKKIENIMELDFAENDEVQAVSLLRGSEKISVPIKIPFKEFIEEYFKYPPQLRKPLIVDRKGNYYAVSIQKGQINWKLSLEEISQLNSPTLYLYHLDKPYSKQEKEVPLINFEQEQLISFQKNSPELFFKGLLDKDFFPLDLQVEKVIEGGAANKAGLKANDILVSLDGVKLSSFDQLRAQLQTVAVGRSVLLQYYRNDVLHSVHIHPDASVENQKNILRLGIYSNADFLPMTFIATEGKSLLQSAIGGAVRTWDGTVRTLIELKRLIMHEVSLKNVGGPLAIGKVASDSLMVGLSYFFKIMAIISINLALINLFPIPVLDGGHILFLAIEAIMGKPLSRRKMEWAQHIGLSILFLLIFVALFNDLSRIFNF